jgi:hypothetical protein
MPVLFAVLYHASPACSLWPDSHIFTVLANSCKEQENDHQYNTACVPASQHYSDTVAAYVSSLKDLILCSAKDYQ